MCWLLTIWRIWTIVWSEPYPRREVLGVGVNAGTAWGAAVSVAVATTLLLSACTPDPRAPQPTGSVENPAPSRDAKPTPEPAPTADASIVVAALDVDGLHVTVSGFVTGFVEDGGDCEFRFAGDGADLVSKTTGLADRMSTSCGSVSVPTSDFSRGSWTVTLAYSSVSSEAVTSPPVNLEIP